MADKPLTENEKTRATVWTILAIITAINIFLSLWFYSGLVGDGLTNSISSGFNELTSLC